MEDFKGKVAFITGGGSGAGLGQAKVFGKAGCHVVIADIRDDHLDGVVNGVQTFMPRMIAHGQGGYIVNTASLGAFLSGAIVGIYCASKAAVVALSEALAQALTPYNIGVSVLCPANIKSNISEAMWTRPSQAKNTGYQFDDDMLAALRKIHAVGMEPVELAQHTLEAVKRNQLYILPIPRPAPGCAPISTLSLRCCRRRIRTWKAKRSVRRLCWNSATP